MTLPILFLASIATLPYPSVTPSQLQSEAVAIALKKHLLKI